MIRNFFPGVFLIVMSAFVLWTDFKTGSFIGRDIVLSDYPTARAIVTRSGIESKSDTEQASQYGLAYNYQVNEREYVGGNFHDEMLAGRVTSAREIQSDYPVGSRVNVHYNPADPSDSVVTTGLRFKDALALICLGYFNMVVVGGWCKVATLIAGLPHQQNGLLGIFSPPVTRLVGKGGQVRLRLEHGRPTALFVCSLLAASYGMGLVVTLAFGGDVGLAQIGVAWAWVLGLTVALTVWDTRRIATGRYDFLVDHQRGTLILPPAFRDKTANRGPSTAARVEVALADIVNIYVDHRVDKDDEHTRVYYEPVIRLDGVGAEATLRVMTRTTVQLHASKIVRELRREVGLTA